MVDFKNGPSSIGLLDRPESPTTPPPQSPNVITLDQASMPETAPPLINAETQLKSLQDFVLATYIEVAKEARKLSQDPNALLSAKEAANATVSAFSRIGNRPELDLSQKIREFNISMNQSAKTV